jgi:cytochrome c peroxidase
LNWDLLNDGVGNPKNTKSMLLAHKTPPAMAEGVRPTAEAGVRAGLSGILFADRPEDEAAAIDEYLRSLKPVPSPHLVDGRLSPAAERGKKLFESDRTGCGDCHPAPLYTDLKPQKVGTRGAADYVDAFDTPTLIEVWRTAPYLHDGRHATIKELIVNGKHGAKDPAGTRPLSEQEIDDLVEFVLSL